MRQNRFSEELMGAILIEPDLVAVVEAERNRNASEQTIYIWRRRFGVLDANDVRRRRELESESTRLKRMLSEHAMAIDTLKEINRRKSFARRCVERRWPRQLSGVVRSDARAS